MSPRIRALSDHSRTAPPRRHLREQAHDRCERLGKRLGALEERALRLAVDDGRRDDERRRVPILVRGVHELVDMSVDRGLGGVLDRGEVEVRDDGRREILPARVVSEVPDAPLCVRGIVSQWCI